jgi:hypothetical protein
MRRAPLPRLKGGGEDLQHERKGQKLIQSQRVQAAVLTENRVGTIPISMRVPLEGLEPGEYQCQVSVLDPDGNRAVFLQGLVAIVTTRAKNKAISNESRQ